MIDSVLSFTANFVNKELKLVFGISEDKVIASSLINLDGSITENIENKIIISLINLEHETFAGNPGQFQQAGNAKYGKVEQPVYLNLYLLVAANYNAANYIESLKMLSATIAILQSNPSFDINQNPDMDSSIPRLSFEIHNIPINELSHIWNGIGAKYVPSIIYKVRMLTIQKSLMKAEIPSVSGVGASTNR